MITLKKNGKILDTGVKNTSEPIRSFKVTENERQSKIKDFKIKIRDIEIELKNTIIKQLEYEQYSWNKEFKSKYELPPKMRYNK